MRISDWSSDVCSSDLSLPPASTGALRFASRLSGSGAHASARRSAWQLCQCARIFRLPARRHHFYSGASGVERSEEHTSELQSLMRISYAVFCLKKKKINNTNTTFHCYICYIEYIYHIL